MRWGERTLHGIGGAGVLAVGVGLIIFGAAWWRAASLPPMPSIEEIDAIGVADTIAVFELDDRLATVEQRSAEIVSALDALRHLGPRVAAVEATLREIEARSVEPVPVVTVRAAAAPAPAARLPRASRASRPQPAVCPILTAVGL